ncbi:MAG: L7Ae/L30e/S12e/Gadd45 family ribosomal protein [Lachnospiraceae bacterium]
MKQNKIYSLLGLATRSRSLVSGEFMTETKIKQGDAKLVVVSEDASENTKKKFYNTCNFYRVPLFFYGTREELGHAMGKELRASLAITDEGFAKSLKKMLEEERR